MNVMYNCMAPHVRTPRSPVPVVLESTTSIEFAKRVIFPGAPVFPQNFKVSKWLRIPTTVWETRS